MKSPLSPAIPPAITTSLLTDSIPFKNSSPFVVVPSLKTMMSLVSSSMRLLHRSAPFLKLFWLVTFVLFMEVFSKIEIERTVCFVEILWS